MYNVHTGGQTLTVVSSVDSGVDLKNTTFVALGTLLSLGV